MMYIRRTSKPGIDVFTYVNVVIICDATEISFLFITLATSVGLITSQVFNSYYRCGAQILRLDIEGKKVC